MAKYTFNDFLKECKEAIKELLIKIWGEDLPKDMSELYPDSQYTMGEQIKYYEEDRKKLAKRRLIIFIILVILIAPQIIKIPKNIIFKLKNKPIIACWNKPICIYRDAKHIYPSMDYYLSKKIDDKHILFFSYNYGKNAIFPIEDYDDYVREPLFSKISYLISQPIDGMIYLLSFFKYDFPFYYSNFTFLGRLSSVGIPKDSFEIYDIKTKKFKKNSKLNKLIPTRPQKLKNKKSITKKQYMDSEITPFYDKKNNRLLIFPTKQNYSLASMGKINFNKDTNITIYNLNSNIIEYQTLYAKNNLKYLIVGYYKDQFLLLKSINENKNEQQYYLFDLDNFNLNQLPDLPIKYNYTISLDDTFISDSGRIIIYPEPTKSKYFEIYTPKENKFYAQEDRYNFHYNNILNIEKDNGDIIFLNRNGSFILRKSENRIEQFSDIDTQFFIENILTLMKNYLNINTNDEWFINKFIKLKLDNNRFLILTNENRTIDSIYSSYNNHNQYYKTIYIDYKNNIVMKGPDIPLYIYQGNAETQQIGNNKFLLYQGERKACIKLGSFCPTRYSYIINIKK